MKLQWQILFMLLWLSCYGCDNSTLESLTGEEINAILAHVNENDPEFVKKEVPFDSIITSAGYRSLNSNSERIKAKLYYYGDRTRGYYNLSDRDDKNLQVFGRKVGDYWALKCVTKLNMEEAGGFIILRHDGSGIWSNGHYNFKTGTISTKKQYRDYDELESW